MNLQRAGRIEHDMANPTLVDLSALLVVVDLLDKLLQLRGLRRRVRFTVAVAAADGQLCDVHGPESGTGSRHGALRYPALDYGRSEEESLVGVGVAVAVVVGVFTRVAFVYGRKRFLVVALKRVVEHADVAEGRWGCLLLLLLLLLLVVRKVKAFAAATTATAAGAGSISRVRLMLLLLVLFIT